MRKSVRALAPILALAFVCVAAPSASAASIHHARLRIESRASAIYLYDGSVDGTGPAFPASSASADLKNCPDGYYYMDASLVQDGQATDWATSALGAGEVLCGGADGNDFTIGMSFYSPTLHAGPATVTFSLRSEDDDSVLVTETRDIRIRRK